MPPADTDGDGSGSLFRGLFDLPGLITDALTGFLSQFVDQAQKPVLAALGQTLLATPDVSANPQLVEIWTGVLGTTVAAYVLFILAGGVLVMGHETVQTRYSLKQIAPRLVIGLAAAVTSLPVMSQAITLANAGSLAITSSGVNSKGLAQQLATGVLRGAVDSEAYLLTLHLILLVLVFGVLIGYGMRVALVYVLAVAAPLALACHALPVTEGLARLWWRGFFGCLVIQLAQSATLIVGMRLYFADDSTIPVLGFPRASHLGTTIAGLCLFWMLLKIPGWTARVVFRSTPVTMPGMPLPLRLVRSLAIAHVLRGAFRSSSTPPGRGRIGGRRSGPAGPTPPGPGPVPGSGGAPHGGGGTPRQPAGSGPVAPSAGPPPPAGSPPPLGGAPPVQPQRAGNTPVAGPGPGPGAVPPAAQAPKARQLALRIPVMKVPGRPGRPVQTWLPVPATRQPRPPATPPPSSPAAPTSTASRGRQTVLPISVPRVPARPPRPVQLRLPLEQPPYSPRR